MAKNHKSESLFGNDEQLNAPRKQVPRRSPEEIAKIRRDQSESSRNDYIFKGELKKAFRQQSEMHESNNSPSIIQELEAIRESVTEKEISIVVKANQRRKRHYLLNGDVCIYCYVKNLWPKLIIKPLTISLDDKEVPVIDGYDDENEFVVRVLFRPITIEIRRRVDPFIFDQFEEDSGRSSINHDEYKKLAFICCFKEWNIPVNINIEDNRVTEESWSEIEKSIHPRLFDIIMGEFISLNEIHSEEIKVLEQQCERLFAKKSQGVSNPIEGIRLYCEASTFAKEFNLSGKNLNDLSYRIASMMKYVSNKGNEIQIRQLDQSSKSNAKKSKSTMPGRR